MNHFVVGDIDMNVLEPLTKILESRPLATNAYRVMSGFGRSQCFGVVKQRTNRYHGSRQNYLRMDIFEQLLIIQSYLPDGFEWDGIQVNQNYMTNPHKDEGNQGMSAIIGFGDYTGGELFIEDTSVDIKNKIVLFDGSLYTHHTAAFTGNRYSLVFFRVKRNLTLKPVYSLVMYDDKMYLKEVMRGVERWWDKRGNCIWSTDGKILCKRVGKAILAECE